MRLGNETSSVYFSFENVGRMAVFGIAFPTPNPSISVKALAAADVSGHHGQASRPSTVGLTPALSPVKIGPAAGTIAL